MATDLVLRVLGPSLHRGHLVSLLRNAEGSGFFDHDLPDLFDLNERLVQEAREHFGEDEVFPEGPLFGRSIRFYSTGMQAQALMGRLVVAAAGISQDHLEAAGHPISDRAYAPFLLDDDMRREILDVMLVAGEDADAARPFMDASHGCIAVLVRE